MFQEGTEARGALSDQRACIEDEPRLARKKSRRGSRCGSASLTCSRHGRRATIGVRAGMSASGSCWGFLPLGGLARGWGRGGGCGELGLGAGGGNVRGGGAGGAVGRACQWVVWIVPAPVLGRMR